MKNFQYSTCIIFVFFVLVISCKKDTPDAPVKHEKGKWLLSKVHTTYIGGYNPPPAYVSEEYFYNAQQRPFLDIAYNSTVRHDTTRLDSLFYDDQNRLSRMGMVLFAGYNTIRVGYQVKTIHYAADGKIDTIKLLNPASANPVLYIMTYNYQGDVITEYVHSGAGDKPFVDSFRYTYNNGNLVEWRNFANLAYPASFAPSPEVYTYSDYDDCYNVLSYLNMNVYLPSLNCASCYTFANYYNEPLISKNNYFLSQIAQTSYQQFEGFDFTSANTYQYTKDSTGLILDKTLSSPGSLGKTKLSYEYIPMQ